MRRFINLLYLILFCSGLEAQVTEEPAGNISGVFYIDYFLNAQRDENFHSLPNKAMNGGQGVHGLHIKRIYFTYDYRFNSKFSSRFRLESDEANFTTNSSGDKASKFGMFVKDAHVKWNFSEGHQIIVGIQSTPAYEISEMVWGNRYIEKTFMDLRKIVPSRDMAVSLKGKIDSKAILNYWLMYGNNSPGAPETNKYKRYFALLETKPIANLYFTIYSDLQSKQPVESIFIPGEQLPNNILTHAVFAGYRKKDVFNGGIEIYKGTIQNGFQLTGNYAHVNSLAVSVFGTLYINSKFNVFGRYDFYEPNSHQNSPGDIRHLIIAGLAVKPAQNFTISPNMYIEAFEAIEGKTIKSSITPRLTASWAF